MKFVIQRVTHAEVAVEGEVIGKIGKGFMVLIGVAQDDTRVIADKMVKKLTGLRIFEDENGKTNLASNSRKSLIAFTHPSTPNLELFIQIS